MVTLEDDSMAGNTRRGLSPSKTRKTGDKAGDEPGKMPRISTRKTPSPALPDEKQVKPTRKTVAVKPGSRRRNPEPRGAAVDRRTQFSGTDELEPRRRA